MHMRARDTSRPGYHVQRYDNGMQTLQSRSPVRHVKRKDDLNLVNVTVLVFQVDNPFCIWGGYWAIVKKTYWKEKRIFTQKCSEHWRMVSPNKLNPITNRFILNIHH